MDHGSLAASIGRRLASLTYECLLLIAVLAVAWLLPHALLGMVWQRQAPAGVVWLHFLIVPGVYFTWLHRHGGQTLAMQTWKLKLVDARTGGRVSLGQAWLRYALAWTSLLGCGLGFCWALVDRDRQFLHDRLAGTRVVSAFPPTRSSPPPAAGTSRWA